MTSEYSIPVREIPIATLGQAKIPSPLPYGNMINTGKVMLIPIRPCFLKKRGRVRICISIPAKPNAPSSPAAAFAPASTT